jgi:two-component system nitrogen regulation response regulator NtrX
LRELALKEGEPEKSITEDAMALLMDHNWPGNVRELKNFIERLVIMTHSEVISSSDIPPLVKGNQNVEGDAWYAINSYRQAKMNFEKRYLARKLREYEGNISRTAESIGLERSNLHRKIKSYGLEVKDGS